MIVIFIFKQIIKMPDKRTLTEHLSSWYDQNRRDLPWRKTDDPYRIWLSEILLQQTRVVQGLPYFNSFIKKFPTIFSLAGSSEQEVLRIWQGLGYYSRARNMHKCARIIVEKYNGDFPRSYDQLLDLPGIGEYTAAAIASIAFNEPVPVVDGNVFRVLSRIFGIVEDISSHQAKRIFKEKAEKLISKDSPGDFNQAIMEFGALKCLPQNPACDTCSLNEQCFAYQNGLVNKLPIKAKKKKAKARYFHYLILNARGLVYLRKRTEKDIWQGLYEFYMIETGSNKHWSSTMDEQLYCLTGPESECHYTIRHTLTHQIIHASFYYIDIDPDDPQVKKHFMLSDGKFYAQNEIRNLPKPVLIDKYLKGNFF